jgi:hypothetical protein
MSPGSDKAFQHNRDELLNEIACAANSVSMMCPIIINYADLGYKGPLENAVKNLVANARQVVLVYNMLDDLLRRQQAASQERSAV